MRGVKFTQTVPCSWALPTYLQCGELERGNCVRFWYSNFLSVRIVELPFQNGGNGCSEIKDG